ncbi:MAG: hypothetical protein GY738_19755, partial [Pseudoalteromonas sp.]|nr:hypothetical protein [Pseudoalteromonas sp.]
KMSLKEMEVAVAATEVADIEFLSKVVLGLNVDMDGKKVENKPSSIIAMFTDERTSWILQQVMDAKADEKLFFKG